MAGWTAQPGQSGPLRRGPNLSFVRIDRERREQGLAWTRLAAELGQDPREDAVGSTIRARKDRVVVRALLRCLSLKFQRSSLS